MFTTVARTSQSLFNNLIRLYTNLDTYLNVVWHGCPFL